MGEARGKFWDGSADALDHAACKLVAAVSAVVCVVFEGGILAGKRVCWVVDECFFRVLRAKRRVELETHGVEVNDRDLVLSPGLADGLCVVAESFHGGVALPAPALHGREENGDAAFAAGCLDVAFEVRLVAGEGAGTGGFVFLVVVTELDKKVVAGSHHAEDFFQPFLAFE